VLLGGILPGAAPAAALCRQSLVVEDPLEKSDAIIIFKRRQFLCGPRDTRRRDIFGKNSRRWWVASGIRLRPNAGIAELMTHDLVSGVFRGKTSFHFRRTPTTPGKKPGFCRSWYSKKAEELIVVTSNYHTRRASTFSKSFRQDVTIRMAGARDADYDPEHWWSSASRLSATYMGRGYVVAWWELR